MAATQLFDSSLPWWQSASRDLESCRPEEILRSVRQQISGRMTVAIGFGVEGCVLVDLAARHNIDLDFFTLDTGLFFPETYALWQKLESTYGVRIRAVRPSLSLEEQAATHGAELWKSDPARCCDIRKVAPLRQALRGAEAWVSAIRRDQTAERKNVQIIEPDVRFALLKISPLAAWSADDVWAHVKVHDVPFNPLHEQGYPSIGCQPCTTPVSASEDPRAGRWRGSEKTECGLHSRRLPVIQGG